MVILGQNCMNVDLTVHTVRYLLLVSRFFVVLHPFYLPLLRIYDDLVNFAPPLHQLNQKNAVGTDGEAENAGSTSGQWNVIINQSDFLWSKHLNDCIVEYAMITVHNHIVMRSEADFWQVSQYKRSRNIGNFSIVLVSSTMAVVRNMRASQKVPDTRSIVDDKRTKLE